MKRAGIWFPAKRYGWGWGLPCAWQGWAVLLLYLGLLAVSAFAFPPDRHPGGWSACVAGLTLLLVAVAWRKGEKPRWRWGGAGKPADARPGAREAAAPPRQACTPRGAERHIS